MGKRLLPLLVLIIFVGVASPAAAARVAVLMSTKADEYEAALRVNPNLLEVKLQVGVLYARAGRLADALRLARELEQSAPKSPMPTVLKGVVLLAQQNPQGAVDAFNAALKLKPSRQKPAPSA